MPREKELFRDNLERLDKAFPDKEILNYADVLKYTGFKDYRAVKKRFNMTKQGISKVKLASALS